MLRDYQKAAIQKLKRSITGGKKKPLLTAPTGSGKTHLAIAIIQGAVEKGNRVLFLAPRRELIYQASERLFSHSILHGVLMAGEPANRMEMVQVASFDTLHARGIRTKRIFMPRADVVIVDEAHLSLAKTRKDIIEHYSDAVIIGLTATPARGDGRGLGEIYDDLITTTTVRELTDQGYLAPVRYFAPSEPDLKGLKLNKDGDYQERGLAERVDHAELIGDVVHNWKRIARDRQTVVFAVNRAHSRHLRDSFIAAGFRAEHLDGETPLDERKAILKRVASSETQILCNVFVATFGLDIPALSCAVLARPTRNITLYLQTAGRVLRTCEGKEDAIIIDHAGAVKENGFVDDLIPWSLDAESKVKDRKLQQQEEYKEPKEIVCGDCGVTFKGSRVCPGCGSELIPASKPIPTHQANLQEVEREVIAGAKRANRADSWEQKQQFIGELRGYANQKGFRAGWSNHKYRAKYGCWPNDNRVKHQPPITPGALVKGWMKHEAIKRGRAA